MSDELRPCGFCEHDGARVIVVDEVTDAGCEEATVPLYAASCPYCGARGPMALSEGEAVEAWNRRAGRTCSIKAAPHDKGDAAYRCSACGAWFTDDASFLDDGSMEWFQFCPNCGARVVD